MNYDELYSFSFRIETVGVKDVGIFEGVVSELRYYFTGIDKNNKVEERFAVHTLNVENLVEEEFIPLDRVESNILHDWLKLSINIDNLENMKRDIHLLFNPPIKYYNLSHFIPKPEPQPE